MNYKFWFSTLAILFMATVNAYKLPRNFLTDLFKSSDSVDVPQKGGDYEFDVAPNSSFSVNLAGNPTTGYEWYLDNKSEVEASSIVLVGQNYAQKKNPEKKVGTGGNFIFNFKSNEVCGKKLPTLVFSYKRSWENNAPAATSKITLKADCEKKQLKKVEADGSSDIVAKVNEPFQIKLAGNPTTGYNWVLKNLDEIKASPLIEQLSNNYNAAEHEEGMVGVGGTFIFEYEVNEKACGQTLPKLVFSYERSWEKDSAVKTAEYTIKVDEDSCEAITEKKKEQEEGNKVIDVKNDESITVKLPGNPTTGYSWILENDEEISSCGVVEKIKDDFVEDGNDRDADGVGGTFIFEFRVKNACGYTLPKLVFAYKRPWETESAEKREYTLNLKDECPKKAAFAAPQEAVATGMMYEVKNNESFKIRLDGNATTGYSWILNNADEVKDSGVIEKVKEDYIESVHEEGMVGVGGKFVFEFKVKDACGKDLPKLSFIYKQPWMKDDPLDGKIEYSLILKGCEWLNFFN